MGWKNLALWKKFLVYLFLMILILVVIDILENNLGLLLYGIVIIITALVMLVTYLVSTRFKRDITKLSLLSYPAKGVIFGLFVAFVISLVNLIIYKLKNHETASGIIVFGCKMCTGFGFLGGGGCDYNFIPNCPIHLFGKFVLYAIPALILGILIGWIYGLVKRRKENVEDR